MAVEKNSIELVKVLLEKHPDANKNISKHNYFYTIESNYFNSVHIFLFNTVLILNYLWISSYSFSCK